MISQELAAAEVDIHPMSLEHREQLLAFAQSIPAHDLLFLDRDIRNPKVVSAWLEAIAKGDVASLMACADGEIVATTAAVRDPLSWSAHVTEIRLLIAPSWRGKGIGRALLDACIERALADGATKLTARIVPDQRAAITLFEDSGFRAEAMLVDHVRDEQGQFHDLAVLSLDVGRAAARQEALFGGD